MADITSENLMPLVAAIGLGIQQFNQVVVDPIASLVISALKGRPPAAQRDGTALLPGGISDVDAKKAILGLASFILGIIIASAFDIEILKTLKIAESNSGLDLFVTALIISAGTEGANSGVKLLQYLKDALKKKTPASVEQQSPVPQAPSKPVS